jgi:hypothetical protein
MPEPNATAPREDDDVPSEPDDELQFEQAEYTTPAPSGPSCVVCKRPIADLYYEISGKVFCGSCRQGMEAAFRGGSRIARVIKALIFGSVAALVGAALYYAFVRLTNINFGLAAVVLGLMVGGAVRAGTGNRGGRFYQLLAVFLTYSAIGAMDLSFVIEGAIRRGDPEKKQAKVAVVKAEKDQATETPDEARPPMSLPKFLVLAAVVLCAGPVIEVFQAPISGLIYSFALWEAWKINKGAQLSFNGPFRVTTAGSIGPAPEDVDDAG